MFVAVKPLSSVTVTSTSKVPAAVGMPTISASPGLTHHDVTPLPVRIDMPGGSPVAVHWNGPDPVLTLMPLLQATKMVQSSNRRSYGVIVGRGAGCPTTMRDMYLL